MTLAPHYINAGQHYVTVNNGTGSGYYDYGDTVTISATVPSHYEFRNWSVDTAYLTDIYSSYQSFTMGDESITLTANFDYAYSYNSVQIINGLITVNNENVSQADGLRQTNSYTLVPQPPDNTQGILNWTVEGYGNVGTDNLGNSTNTFTVGDGNAIITGHYATIRYITISNMNNGGTTSTYSLVQGRKQRFSTTSNIGNYKFNGWYENNTRLSTSTSLDVTMGGEDRTIEARYDYYPTYTVTLVNKDNSGSTTTSQVVSGNKWSASTTEDVGDNLFVRWLKDGVPVSTSLRYEFYVSADTIITCEYRPKETYHLTVNNGTGSGDYKERQSVTIIADAGDFSNWSYSNLYAINSSTSRTTTVKLGRSDGTVTAIYNMRHITVVTNTATTNYNIGQGNSTTINAGTAPTTYEFNHWEITSGDATLANQYVSSTTIYAHTQDSVITAVYTPIPQFTVTMQNGEIWDGSNWVSNATLYRNSTNAIKMNPAPTGHQFLQWEVYENGVLQTNANDVYEPLAEQTRLRNLLRNITIKATYYIPDPETTYSLTIERKDGSIDQYSYAVATDVQISASTPDQGYEFYKWTGDTSYVAGGIYNSNTYVHMPAQNIRIKENYVPEGYIPEYELVMTNLYAQCCYTTSQDNSEHWVSRWSYPEGTTVKIRTTGVPDEYYFSAWTAINHSTSEDARSVITNLLSANTTLTMPNYDIDVEPTIALKTTYSLRINDGNTSGYYYEGARADVYFNKIDTNDVHYQFLRWTGTNISQLELYDGGMFNVLTPGTQAVPQYIKMPNHAVEITATYNTLYRLTLTNATINTTGTSQGYYVTGTTLNITANTPPNGMRFQYWTGDTDHLGNIYDPTTTITTVIGTTSVAAVYSTDANRNGIGYSTVDLKATNTVNNSTISVISGEIENGFIITDVNGHVYIVTNVDTQTDTSTIYRMTKIVRGGNLYG